MHSMHHSISVCDRRATVAQEYLGQVTKGKKEFVSGCQSRQHFVFIMHSMYHSNPLSL